MNSLLTSRATTVFLLLVGVLIPAWLLSRDRTAEPKPDSASAAEVQSDDASMRSELRIDVVDLASRYEPSELPFRKTAVGIDPDYAARVTNVQVLDFDGDGKQDLLVCDAGQNAVLVYFQEAGYQELDIKNLDRRQVGGCRV